MKIDELTDILKPWGIGPTRVRTDFSIAGSPERCESRSVIEDVAGSLFLVEGFRPEAAPRKAEIARLLGLLSPKLPEINPCVPFADGCYLAERDGGFWQVSRFLEGLPLQRPEYAFEGWRGPVLAGFLARLKRASARIPGPTPGAAFSLPGFIDSLAGKIRSDRPSLCLRLQPAITRLEKGLFDTLPGYPVGFCHGDYHPLNIIWTADGIRAVIDWEFCGPKPELYDAAILVGCLGMEHPQSLTGDLVAGLVARLITDGGYDKTSWRAFVDLVLACRFAWLSDWLRRRDEEMIELETAYIGLLFDNRGVFARSWGLEG